MRSASCQHCGASLPAEDPLEGGVCEACLWQELSGAASSAGIALQHLVEGHDILEELGRGGMGVVYRARQHSPRREVALKMLLPLDSGREEVRRRFQQEARALAELEHPAILPLYEVGEADGLPYFTMKLAGGGTLAQALKRDGPWPARRAVELLAVIADGLQYAHEHGVIHRDIKPGNVLFDEAARAYLADFGLAKLEDGGGSFTHSAGVLGTPAYLAPEIAALGARAATIASDVYSLGAVLYELLTGRPPFVIEGLAALLRQITEEEPDSPSTLNTQVPRDLEIISLKCLRKIPGERYATAAEFAADLRRWLRGEPILARQFTPAERLWKWVRRRPALAALSAALLLLTLGSGLWLAWSNQQLNHALAQARVAQAKADQRAEFFLGSFADSLEGIGRLDLLNVAFADVLATDTGDDEPARRRRAELLTRWGRALRFQGQSLDADAKLEGAIAEAASLSLSEARRLLDARARTELALTQAEIKPVAQPMRDLEALRAELATAPDAETSPVLSEARAIVSAAITQLKLEFAPEQTVTSAAETTRFLRRWLAVRPGDTLRQFALARALSTEGSCLLIAAGKERASPLLATAMERNNEALALLERLCALPHPYADWRREWFKATDAKGRILWARDPDQRAEALRLTEECAARLDRLAADDPLDWRSRLDAAGAHFRLAGMAEDSATRGEHLLRHEAHAAELFLQAPQIRQCALARLTSSMALARWHLQEGRPAETQAHLATAFATGKAIVARRVEQAADQTGFQKHVEGIARIKLECGDAAGARDSYREGLAFLRSLESTGEAADWCRWTEAAFQQRLGHMLWEAGELAEAFEVSREAFATRAGLLRQRAAAAIADPSAVPQTGLAAMKVALARQRVEDALALAEETHAVWRDCAAWAGEPFAWGETIRIAEEAGVAEGGALAVRAREFAARARTELFRAPRREGTVEAAPEKPVPSKGKRPQTGGRDAPATLSRQ